MKMKNDHRSEPNLCNCVRSPKKIQDFNRVWTRDLAITDATLYQLSYEATDVGSRSIVGSYVPVKEMSINDISNKSYTNRANEKNEEKWRNDCRSERNLCNCVKEAWKKFRTSTGFEPVTSGLPVRRSTNWAMKPLTLGAGQLWVHTVNVLKTLNDQQS